MEHALFSNRKMELEKNFPTLVDEALKNFILGQEKLNRGEEYFSYDADHDILNMETNQAEREKSIKKEQADYIRHTFLWGYVDD